MRHSFMVTRCRWAHFHDHAKEHDPLRLLLLQRFCAALLHVKAYSTSLNDKAAGKPATGYEIVLDEYGVKTFYPAWKEVSAGP